MTPLLFCAAPRPSSPGLERAPNPGARPRPLRHRHSSLPSLRLREAAACCGWSFWRNLRGFSRCNSILLFLLLCAQPSIVVSLKDISLLTGTTFMSLCILFVFRGRCSLYFFPFSRLSFATFPSRISGCTFCCS